MLRQTRQLACRQFSRSAAMICDSPWFRLAIVVMLTCLLLPLPRARAITSGCEPIKTPGWRENASRVLVENFDFKRN